MSEWQPIETAPHDGSKVLLGFFGDEPGKFETGFYRWNKDTAKNEQIPNISKRATTPWFDYYAWSSYYSGGPPSQVPTHWMPLEPPQ